MNKITIVTPSYNQGRFIKRCIDSVRNQTYRPIEHIIVDNCSTDETSAILSEYKNNTDGIEVILIVEPDTGQSDALNKGFRSATGTVVGWLNADDYYLNGAFESVSVFFLHNPDVSIAYGDYYFVNENGLLISKRKEIDFDFNIMLYSGCYIPSTATFFKRHIFDVGFALNAEYHYLMDVEFFLRLSKANFRFKHFAEFLACFRWHGNNKSTDSLWQRRINERNKIYATYLADYNYIDRYPLNVHIKSKIYRFKRNIIKLIHGCYFKN